MLRAENKIVFLTGGSRGIGASIKRRFTELGAQVIAPTSSELDLSDVKSLAASFAKVTDGIDKIDVCINNAGINFSSHISELSLDKHYELMDVNLNASLILSKAAALKMIPYNSGRIINIASIAATKVRAGRTSYSISKHGLIGLTKNLAVDLGRYNILCNSVSPGFTNTDMTDTMLPQDEKASLSGQVPLGRFAETDEIANVVLFLASELNSYITGQNIIVDGGYTNAVSV